MTPSQVREIRARVKDFDDPVRFVIASQFSRKFVLYYNVSSDTYAMNDISAATLFKRRRAAEAIRKLFGPNDCLLEVRVMKNSSVKRVGRYRKPLLKRRRKKG
ncbi:MAG: hypothetical protein A2151_03220 [Candidatus Muproteobacteria bacterium RBG_16_65_34]|uniref:Uncharacterized protein n=1 Tax=Candidatus Muproteobacteria bacterium RBG_16_65_34 TaxID=1817760 RepID=A0A1F6TRH7_9PROT|nr:MAG: hypothetical protein A2151_03220 [Candidatus Muproteobacteria bacterium RBG_16_65_34]